MTELHPAAYLMMLFTAAGLGILIGRLFVMGVWECRDILNGLLYRGQHRSGTVAADEGDDHHHHDERQDEQADPSPDRLRRHGVK